MKRITAVCIAMLVFLSVFSLPVFGAEERILIDAESAWKYVAMDTASFVEMDSEWMTKAYDCDWETGNAPFGDRIDSDNAARSGWVDDLHGLYLRQTFRVEDLSELEDMHIYLHTYYDNTVYMYLNGECVFFHDGNVHSGNDWTDDYVLYEVEGIFDYLQEGENLFAVSVLDDIGGREFDLSLFASEEQLDPAPLPVKRSEEETDPPVNDKEDDLPVTEDPDDIGNDFGSALPFTKAPQTTAAPVVTAYLTSDDPDTSPAENDWIAPLSLVGASLLIAIGMVITAFLIAGHRGKGGEHR